MDTLQVFYLLVQLVLTAFVLGVAYEVTLNDAEDDDDDDGGGGILQPCYVTEQQ